MTIEKPTAQEQAQARQMRAMMEALRTAGYGLGSPGELQAGMLAYNAAVVIQERAPVELVRRTPGAAKVGRNDACPCGSGKKYKKCCMDKATGDQDKPAAGPSVDPRLIPRLANNQAADRDLRQLGVQLLRDPVLATIRFPAAEVEAAVAQHRSTHPELDDAQVEATLDTLAHEFARQQPATAEVIARLSDELLDAARRASSTDELRALALGLALAILHGSHNPDSPVPSNPLVDLLFRITWIEARTARPSAAAVEPSP